MAKIYKANARGQISLGKFLEPGGYYMATADEEGRVTLVPVVVKPITDLVARQVDPGVSQA